MVAARRLRMSSFFRIDGSRILEDRLDHAPMAVFEPLIETEMPAGMTGNAAALFHDEQYGVVVAVEADFAHVLHVPRFLAFSPQPAARARPVVRKPARGR